MKVKGLIASAIGALAIGCTLTGCETEILNTVSAEESNNFIAIVGNHAGSLKPTYSTSKNAVMDACKAEGTVAVIVADGEPYLATGNYIDIPKQQNNLSSSKLKQIYTSQTEQIMTLMESSYAKTEEVDLLKAIDLCAREAQSSQFEDGKTEIYIYDAGVSTVYLNMTMMDLEYIDADSVVATLKDKNMIPDLSGLDTIHWFNIGDVDYQISNGQIEGIKKIWRAIIEAGGCKVEFYTDPSTTEFDVELPHVSEIPYTVDSVEFKTEKETSKEVEEIENPIVFTESEIGFEPGAVTFIDKIQATETLSAVTDFLNENEDINILIAATTADWGTTEYQSKLSADRAMTVKNQFVKAGIDESRITTIGLGSTSGFYKYDKNIDGSLNDEIASRNRSIVIMDVTSDRATQILAGKFKRGEMYE
ncbi:MAG: OmpA family protein [Lachnospiraceae bacterium]|nr:OmpA family protein [Lachnospiraceae bacterium]